MFLSPQNRSPENSSMSGFQNMCKYIYLYVITNKLWTSEFSENIGPFTMHWGVMVYVQQQSPWTGDMQENMAGPDRKLNVHTEFEIDDVCYLFSVVCSIRR